MNTKKIKEHCLFLLCAIATGLTLGMVFSHFYILYHTIEYEPKMELLDRIEPEMKEGLSNIYFTNDLTINPEYKWTGKSYLGVYSWLGRFIKISINNETLQEISLDALLCHELGHHIWATKLSKEDKNFWKREYLKLEKKLGKKEMKSSHINNENELHSFYYENHPQICFKDY